MAKRMVCEWGMSKALGPLNYAAPHEHVFLGRDITRTEGVSQTTAREIDVEVRRLVDEAEARATKILTDHKDLLVKLAEALLVNETMTAAEVYELLGLPPRVLSNEGFEDEKSEENPDEKPAENPQEMSINDISKETIKSMVELLESELNKRKDSESDEAHEEDATAKGEGDEGPSSKG